MVRKREKSNKDGKKNVREYLHRRRMQSPWDLRTKVETEGFMDGHYQQQRMSDSQVLDLSEW